MLNRITLSGDKLNGLMAAAGLVVLAGCSTFEAISAYETPVHTYRPAPLKAPVSCVNGEYNVTIRLLDAKDAMRECSTLSTTAMACFKPYAGGGVIVSALPKSWNDQISLATIGHEMLHLCGARHE
ncbi:MAG: hypothetical protein H7232_03780 [Aeromicrobium sp.]|nr:hypothetical protein [Burkholderiales bacterium]